MCVCKSQKMRCAVAAPGSVSVGSRAKGVWAQRSAVSPGWLLLFSRRQRPQEAKLSVCGVLAAVVSERAAGLLLFRRHFLILVTRIHEMLRDEVSMTNCKPRASRLMVNVFFKVSWQSMFFENMFFKECLKVPKYAILKVIFWEFFFLKSTFILVITSQYAINRTSCSKLFASGWGTESYLYVEGTRLYWGLVLCTRLLESLIHTLAQHCQEKVLSWDQTQQHHTSERVSADGCFCPRHQCNALGCLEWCFKHTAATILKDQRPIK